MTDQHLIDSEPSLDCPLCPRLQEFRLHHRSENPQWHNAPVPTWFPNAEKGGREAVKLLIVGLAPGLKGANKTGRPFTGDYAGDLLYETLVEFGFAEGRYDGEPSDSLKLNDCAITNSVRCVPPQNKPVGAEINSCRPFLDATIASIPSLKVMVTLGKIAHDSTARTLATRVASVPFGHNRLHKMAEYTVVSSYHCSRYNTNTGKLTTPMFRDVFRTVRQVLNEA